MANIQDAFQPENGINLDDLVGIFAGTIDPSTVGESAPIGSLFIRDNGLLYQKYGPANTNWIVFSQGLGEAVKISATDTNAGYLNTKLLVTASFSKSVQNAGANETLTLDLANVGTAGTYRSVTTNSKGQVTAGSNPSTLAGYGISDAQPLDSDLTALSNTSTTGLYSITGSGTSATRAITGTPTQIDVSNGNGINGNPTLSFPSTGMVFPGVEGFVLASGTTAQRFADAGIVRFNTDTSRVEYYNGTTWVSLIASTGGTVTSITTSQPAAGFTITGGPITNSGTFVFTLTDDLAGLEGIAGIGFAVRTGLSTWVTRGLYGTLDRITVGEGLGTTTDTSIDIASTYAGQSSITTLGVIGTGTWQGTTVSTAFGGTGRSSIGTANQLLGVNTTSSGLEYKTLGNGTGIGLVFTGGQITVQNTGVTSITGTTNQVNASAASGAVTLSLPQNINTTATPTFASVTVAANPTLPLQLATKQYVDNAVQGVSPKQSARIGTLSQITLSGLQTIDGVSTIDGDRILVKNQTAPAENGVYIAATGAWTRASDMDAWTEVPSAFVFIEEGSQADTAWVSTANQGGTLGTTAVPFVQFSSAGDIAAGTGLTKTVNTLSITNVGTAGTYNTVTTNAQGQVTAGSNVGYLTGNQTITLQGDVAGIGTTLINTVLSNTGVTAGTYKSVTVDAKGRVTAATNPNTLAGYGITDAQPLDIFLTSIAALTPAGIIVHNGNTAQSISVVPASTKVSVTNGDGIAGNPAVDVVESNLTLNNIGGTLGIAKGGTNLTALGAANTVLGVNGTATGYEFKAVTAGAGITVTPGVNTLTIAAVNSGTVTSVAATGSTGLTVGGSPITSTGTLTFTLGAELQGLSALAANGVLVRTGAGTYAARSVTSGVGTITITNPTGTAGNIALDLTTIGTAGTYKSVSTDAFGRVTAGTNPTTLSGYGITDAVSSTLLGAVNGVATLDGTGKLTLTQLPAIAITDTFVVSSQVSMLALTAQVGDVAVRSDLNRSYILQAEPATVLANWQELMSPTDSVLSVNGQTGVVSVGTVTSMNVIGTTGILVTGGPVTTAGSVTLSLTNDLSAVEGLVGTGFAVRTGIDTWDTRSFVAGSGITLSNTDGIAGPITISATGAGSVTSVGLALPSMFTVTGSPITSTGTLTGTLASQTASTFFVAPLAGGVPTFRTVGLDELSDVVLTAPATGNVLSFNGTNWVNTAATAGSAAGLIGVGQAGVAAWTLVSGTRYRADFVHNLGTNNLVITVFDSATNAIVIPDSVVLTNTNTIRVTVIGNTRTLRVVSVANGLSVGSGGGGSGSLAVSKDGTTIAGTTTTMNFTGPVVVSDAGAGVTNLNLISRFSYFANSLDTPNNADFAVNALAPVTTDPTYAALNVRSFSNTVEQGVGFTLSIPPGATQITFKIRGRATTAPGAVSVVQPRLYFRQLPNNAALGAWSAAQELTNVSIPTNAFFQYSTQTVSLTTLGLTADRLYQFELTRRVTGVTGTNLGSAFLLAELTVELY